MVGNEEDFESAEANGSFGTGFYKSKIELWKDMIEGKQPSKNVVLDYQKNEALIETDEGAYLIRLNLNSDKPVEPIGIQRVGERYFEYF